MEAIDIESWSHRSPFVYQGQAGRVGGVAATGVGAQVVIEQHVAAFARDLDGVAKIELAELCVQCLHQFIVGEVALGQRLDLAVRAGPYHRRCALRRHIVKVDDAGEMHGAWEHPMAVTRQRVIDVRPVMAPRTLLRKNMARIPSIHPAQWHIAGFERRFREGHLPE